MAQAPPQGSLEPGAPSDSSPRRAAGCRAPLQLLCREMTLPGGPTGMARPGGAGPCSPGLERAPRRSVGELRLLFEARCAAVAAAAAAGEPRSRGAKRRGRQVPNGLPRAPPAPVIPQLTVTAEEPDVPPASPGPPEPEGGWLPAEVSSHLQQPRRLSTSSLSSTGSSSMPEDSEDDLLSDSESRSRGNVQLEAGEDAGQVRAAGAGPARARGPRFGDPARSALRADYCPELPPPRPDSHCPRDIGVGVAWAVFTLIPQKGRGPSPGGSKRASEAESATGHGDPVGWGAGERDLLTAWWGWTNRRGRLCPANSRRDRGERVSLFRRPLSRVAAPPPPLPRFPSPEWEWSCAPGSAREPPPSAPGARTRRGRGKGGAGSSDRGWNAALLGLPLLIMASGG